MSASSPLTARCSNRQPFSSKVVDTDLTTTLRIWRDPWDDSMDLTVLARRYVGEVMAMAGAPAGTGPTARALDGRRDV
jgi:hypothetical protein